MKKLILISILLVLTVMLTAADAVAMISVSQGKVNLSRNDKTIKHQAGDMLMNNDQLRTGGESFAAYKYIDGSSTIKVFSNSLVKVTASKSGKQLNKKITLNKGSVLTSVKPKTGSLIVQTPTTIASVKGTEFFTKLTEENVSTFIVTDGEVELKILDKSETQLVAKGKTGIVNPDGSFELRNSTLDDLSALEQAEMETGREGESRSMRIPVIDRSGRTRYIEISY